MKDPLSGRKKRKERPKADWLIKEKAEMRIISDELWEATVIRWKKLEEVYPVGKGKPGFSTKQQSRVKVNPSHLLSGSLQCGCCGGSIALVSGKGGGYYGCLNASRKACDNKVLVSRAKLEKQFLGVLCEKVLTPDQFELIYARVAKTIKEEFSELPKEIHLKRTELNSVESRLHNFIEFVAQGRAPKSIVDAMEEAERNITDLKKDLEGLEKSKDSFFEPPPKEWIESKLEDVKSILEKRTEKSALLLRDYLGTVKLTPKKPEVGKSYYHAESKVQSFALLDEAKGSNILRMWTQAGSNR